MQWDMLIMIPMLITEGVMHMAEISIHVEDHSVEILNALNEQIGGALQSIGQEAEGYAKEKSRVDTGRLRNSISYKVNTNDEKAVYVGTNVEYAPYIEYGTGIYADNGEGRKTPWAYQDAKGVWHWTKGMKPTHFLRDSIADHGDHYQAILEASLKR